MSSRPTHAPPAFVPIYSAFAAGYLLSYLYRTVNAVISPELTRDLGLAPGSLGLLTSAYFVSFASMQIPLGMLLDRFGPRRVEPVLLAVAASGALLFALADGLPGLALARAVIGVGVASCLMAPLKGLVLWYPRERYASLSGWMMVAGGLGALTTTTPLELALRVMSWREIFMALSATTLAVAGWLWLKVPDVAAPARPPSLAEQWHGVRRVFSHPRFWWIAPLGGVAMGAFMAIQGLWAVPWMMEVEGLSRAQAASNLLAMSVLILLGYVALGLFATRLVRMGIHASHMFGVGFTMSAISFALIVVNAPGSVLWWSLYGLGAAANILAFAVLNEGFSPELAGRASTALNLTMFGGSFLAQWGIGMIVDALRAALDLDTRTGLLCAFGLTLILNLVTLAWFLLGWKRFAHHHAQTRAGP